MAVAALVAGTAARRYNGTFTSTNATTSTPPRTTAPPSVTVSADGGVSWQTTGIDPVIPGLASLLCYANELNIAPCDAMCGEDDKSCIVAASSQAATCSPQWDAYNRASASWAATYFPPGSTTLIETSTETWFSLEFASYSTDTAATFTNIQGSVYNPIYAFGTPSTFFSHYPPETYTETFPNTAPPTTIDLLQSWTTEGALTVLTEPMIVPQAYLFTKPTPFCSVTGVDTMACGQCTVGGGSVQLFYWPSTTSYQNLTQPPPTTATAVVSGITMISPSVYISLQTVYAANQCRRVGGAHAGSVLTMDPNSVSTVFAANGPGYGPGMVEKINYDDLQGIVPLSVYELNNKCARFGCPTIENDLYRPTLAIPPEIRTLDPAWASCVIDLNGLYDPPSALTPQSTIAAATIPFAGAAQPTPAAGVSLPPAAPSPTPTNPNPSPTSVALPDGDPHNPQPTPNHPSTISPGTASGHAAAPDIIAPSPSQASSSDVLSPQLGVSVAPTISQPTQSASPQSAPHIPSSSFPPAHVQAPGPAQAPGVPMITIGSQIYFQQSESGICIIGTQTLTPGGVITVSGSTLSLPTSASEVIIDGTTDIFASSTTPGLAPTTTQSSGAGPVTQNASGNIVVDGTTLEPGLAITIGTDSFQTTLRVFTTESRTEVVFGTSSTMTLDPESTSNPPNPVDTGSTQGTVANQTPNSGAAILSAGFCNLCIWLSFVIFLYT